MEEAKALLNKVSQRLDDLEEHLGREIYRNVRRDISRLQKAGLDPNRTEELRTDIYRIFQALQDHDLDRADGRFEEFMEDLERLHARLGTAKSKIDKA